MDLKRCKTFGGICRIYPTTPYHAQFRGHLGRFAAIINKSGFSLKEGIIVSRTMTTLFQDHWWLSWNFEFHYKYKYKYKTRSSSDQEWWLRNCETTQGSVAVIGIFWVLGCLSLPGQIQIRAKEKYKYEQWKNTNTDHWQIQMRLLDKYKYKQWKNTNTGKKYN